MQQVRLFGVGVVVVRNKKILLGHQHRSYEEPCWGFPGGKLDEGELPSEAAIREVKEECGIDLGKVELITFFEDIDEKGMKIISFQVMSKESVGDPVFVEREKCDEWRWFDLNEIPKELSENTKRVIDLGIPI